MIVRFILSARPGHAILIQRFSEAVNFEDLFDTARELWVKDASFKVGTISLGVNKQNNL
jgi:hypothetical protein